jgi:N-formylglutamate deformylase
MTFEFRPARTPLLISVPHAGTSVSPEVEQALTEQGRSLVDTDWHVHRLVDFATDLGAGLIRAEYSRYMIDLNRPPDDRPLYQQVGTGLVATETFSGEPLYRDGHAPGQAEIEQRVKQYWQPYHQQIDRELHRLNSQHGFAILFDAHSIASRVPRLFEGRLPDLNLGTFERKSCSPALEVLVSDLLRSQDHFSHVVNGRFKGGFITRHYGRPEQGVHALQLEIAQACYMNEAQPQTWEETRALPLKSLLRQVFEILLSWRPA